jgi:hypothetical protein
MNLCMMRSWQDSQFWTIALSGAGVPAPGSIQRDHLSKKYRLQSGLNEKGLVHDFYYPYVGLENLTTARMQPHHIGVWVDGDFSWIADDS